MTSKQRMYYDAFEIIFEKALEIRRLSDHVTIIYDETFNPYLNSISSVVNDMELSATYIYLPVSYQEMLIKSPRFSFDKEILLPNGTSSAVSNSNIILTFLNADPKLLKVRSAILNENPLKGCKIAHCPGLSDEILELVIKSPYQEVFRLTEMVAWALGNSTKGTILTKGRNDREHRLEIDLQGWDNEPIMSPGIIINGNWGNISPGEAFCCPDHTNINGTICINGSIPGVILKKSEEVLLTFENGKLVSWKTPVRSRANRFLEELKTEAKKNNDHEWNSFAELGIGLNPVITSLTGNALFDEKMAGTIHIAIGDNVIFGHPIQSKRHIDMVVLSPTLILDDKVIIEGGKLYEDTIAEWRNELDFPGIGIEADDKISIRLGKINVIGDTIKRRLSSGNRIGFVNIKDNNYLKNLEILREVLDEEDKISVQKLGEKIPDHEELAKLLHMMHHYKAIEIHKGKK